MRTFMFKISFLAFVVFTAIILLGNKLDPLYIYFGDVSQVRSTLMGATALVFIASLALIVVRTVIGIVVVLVIALILFVFLKMGFLSALGLF